MSRKSIDEGMYDKERYESLRARGISEGRAKRVGTVPLRRNPPRPRSSSEGPPYGDGVGTKRIRVEDQPIGGAHVSTTNPKTGI